MRLLVWRLFLGLAGTRRGADDIRLAWWEAAGVRNAAGEHAMSFPLRGKSLAVRAERQTGLVHRPSLERNQSVYRESWIVEVRCMSFTCSRFIPPGEAGARATVGLHANTSEPPRISTLRLSAAASSTGAPVWVLA